MKVLVLEPFFGGSHRQFWEGFRRASAHDVELLSMSPYHWKWRMRGSAFWMAEALAPRTELPDLLLVSDFLNLPDLVALLPPRWRGVPSAIYFHENQLTYPVSPGEKLDYHFGLINVVSALYARRIFFNSAYHLGEFFEELPRFFKPLPDYRPDGVIERLRARAEHLPLGCDLAWFDRFRGEAGARGGGGPRVILWNHRWEFDKNPEEFFRALYEVKERGHEFRLIVAGERRKEWPAVFDEARERLAGEILSFGTLPSREEYARALFRADVVVSTAIHDFFGMAVAEAIYCGAYPLLPARVAYPELVPRPLRERHLYDAYPSLVRRLRDVLEEPLLEADPSLMSHVARFDWRELAPRYDEAMERAASAPPE